MLSYADKEKIRESIRKQILKISEVTAEPGSYIDFLKNNSANAAAIRDAQTKLLKLEYALSLIDKSELGTCIRCGNIIPFQRLLSTSDITKCASCAQN